MNRSTISQLENDRHGWNRATLRMFAELFGVQEHEVLGYPWPPPSDLTADLAALFSEAINLDERGIRIVLAVVKAAAAEGFVQNKDVPPP